MNKRPLTVNWHDIAGDIHQNKTTLCVSSHNPSNEAKDLDESKNEFEPDTVVALKWLDEGLPNDLSSAPRGQFTLEEQFELD